MPEELFKTEEHWDSPTASATPCPEPKGSLTKTSSDPPGRPTAGRKSLEVWDYKYSGPTQRCGCDDGTSQDAWLGFVDRRKEVVIHVYDEASGASQDFICLRKALLGSMHYFRAHISEDCSWDDLDITVHCDVYIFQWLMVYIHATNGKPRLDSQVAISVLISSHFLQMDDLVETTLNFIAGNLSDILRMPIDFACIAEPLLQRLASQLSAEDLDNVRDRKGRLVPLLFLFKMKSLLDAETGCKLQRCSQCSVLFNPRSRAPQFCPKARMSVDHFGQLLADHLADGDWDITSYLLELRQLPLSWREIYWRVWALITDGYCDICKTIFPLSRMNHCLYHPVNAVLLPGTRVPVYPCCNQGVPPFEVFSTPPPVGCQERSHTLGAWPHEVDSEESRQQREVQTAILKKHPEALLPIRKGRTSLAMLTADHNSDVVPFAGSDPQDEEGSPDDSDSGSSGEFSGSVRHSSATPLRLSTSGRDGTQFDSSKQQPSDILHPFHVLGYGADWAEKGTAFRKKKRKEWWGSLSQKNRDIWLISLQRDDDQRRMRRLIDQLLKKRTDPVLTKLAQVCKSPGPPAMAGKGASRKGGTVPPVTRTRSTTPGRPTLK